MEVNIEFTLSDGFMDSYNSKYFNPNYQERDIDNQICIDANLQKLIADDVINSISKDKSNNLFKLLEPLYKEISNLDLGFIEVSINNEDSLYKDILNEIRNSIISNLRIDHQGFRQNISKEIMNYNQEIRFMDNQRANKIFSAFISYSHDSEDHKQWVLKLCNSLVSKGINVIFDEWLAIGKNVQTFMESCTDQDKVIIVCTHDYVRKANAGEGGVGYEKAIITREIIKDTNDSRFIPVIRQKSPSSDDVPKFIGHIRYINMSDDDKYEIGLDRLSKVILGIDIVENQERNELVIRENILRKILNSKKDSTINSDDRQTQKLLDELLQELGNIRAYGNLEFSYLCNDMQESDTEELRFEVPSIF